MDVARRRVEQLTLENQMLKNRQALVEDAADWLKAAYRSHMRPTNSLWEAVQKAVA